MSRSRGYMIFWVMLALALVIGVPRCHDSESNLSELMARGDVEGLEKALRANPGLVKQRFSLGDTAIHLAIGYARESEFIKVLVAHGADVNAKGGGFHLTPLHKAAWNGKLEVVKILVANGADVNALSEYNQTPLNYAATANSPEIIDVLLANGADLKRGYPVLYSAESHPKIMEHLLSKGADPNAQDGSGNSLLHRAIIFDRTNVVGLLLRFKADLRSREALRATPLASAIEYNKAWAAAMILEASLRENTNALHLAAAQGEVEKLKDLLRITPAGNYQSDELGFTPLHWAAQSGHGEAVEALLALKVDRELTDAAGYRPIDWAAYGGHDKVVEQLLNGQSAAALKRGNDTALLMALRQGQTGTAELLLKRGANANAALPMGRTALHVASGRGDVETTRLLLRYGAHVNAVDQNGMTAIQCAIGAQSKAVLELLVANGGQIGAGGRYGWTLFHDWALGGGDAEVGETLLGLKLDVNSKDKEGKTPLHFAAHQGTTNAVEWLLAHGADPNIKDAQGRTPLGVLRNPRGRYARREIVAILKAHGVKE